LKYLDNVPLVFKVLLPPNSPVPLDINRKTMEKYRPLLEEKSKRG